MEITRVVAQSSPEKHYVLAKVLFEEAQQRIGAIGRIDIGEVLELFIHSLVHVQHAQQMASGHLAWEVEDLAIEIRASRDGFLYCMNKWPDLQKRLYNPKGGMEMISTLVSASAQA